MRIIEEPKGRGRLEGEGVRAGVRYSLRVLEESIDAGNFGEPGATIQGLRTVRGVVEFDSPVQGLIVSGNILVLHLADGRKLKVIFETPDEVVGTGGFF